MKRSLPVLVHFTIGFIVFGLFLLVTTIIFGSVYVLSHLIPIGRKRREGIMYACMILNARMICLLLGVRVDRKGFDEFKSRMTGSNARICFIANHTSVLDIPVIFIGLYPMRLGFIAKKSLFKIPLFRIYLKVSHSIPIDITSVKSNIEAIRKGVDSINGGMPMLIFPEGSRSKTGNVEPFKRGSFKMAQRTGAITVPIALSGLREYFEGRKRIFVSKRGRATVLEEVDFSALDNDSVESAVKSMEEAIREEVQNNG